MSVTSFGGESGWNQLDDGSGGFAVWSKAAGFVVKKIPGGSKNVIQTFAPALPRMTMPIVGTAAQMLALQAKVGVQGTLVFHFETTTARLLSMGPPVSIGIDNDLYFSTLELIRSSPYFAVQPDAILMQTGAQILLETGDYFQLE